MAACHLHVAAIRRSDSSAMWVDHSGVGCNGMVCRLPNSLPAIGETCCTYRMVPRLGGSQCLKQFVVPREDSRLQRRNTTRVFALKPPQQPVPVETEEAEVGIPEEGDKNVLQEVEEEKVIKVEKKGLLRQVQSFFAWIGAWPVIPAKEEFIEVPKDFQDVHVIWEGWGTSLCWWANFVGGLPKEDFDYVIDLLFDARKGLGMNIVRYNIGGGANLTFDNNLRPFGDVPGFKSGPNEPYDWTADKRQRDVLFAARDKGANIFEAFNNSPPHWMTYSGSVTGNWRQGEDNLNPKYYEAFADYLTEVVLKYQEWGLQFDSLAPFNEPCEGWWYVDRNKPQQEGCNFSTKSMDKLIPIVKKSLAKKNLKTALSAFDAWTFNTIRAMRGISEESTNAIDQFNAHTYIFFVNREDDAKRRETKTQYLTSDRQQTRFRITGAKEGRKHFCPAMAGACLFPNAHAALRPLSHSHLQCTKTIISSERRRFRCAVAKNNHLTTELLVAAQERAALRAVESSRDEPLFHDPYAACLTEEALDVANGDDLGYYELATSFIDDNLMEAVKKDGDSLVRQIVLLTDGMDTRPYRLPWPLSSTVFDVSPSTTYNVAAERLEAVGARIRRGCMFRHISIDLSEDGDWKDDLWERNLVSVGYQGTRPSVWAMQGLQTLSTEGLEVILRCVSSLAMKDSIILGELPYSALGDISQETISTAASKVFGSNGFHVSLVLHKEITTSLDSKKRTLTEVNEQHYREQLLFIAKQLRLSDHQVDDARRMMSDREEVDEDGFED